MYDGADEVQDGDFELWWNFPPTTTYRRGRAGADNAIDVDW